jgi:hypothetical protein
MGKIIDQRQDIRDNFLHIMWYDVKAYQTIPLY